MKTNTFQLALAPAPAPVEPARVTIRSATDSWHVLALKHRLEAALAEPYATDPFDQARLDDRIDAARRAFWRACDGGLPGCLPRDPAVRDQYEDDERELDWTTEPPASWHP